VSILAHPASEQSLQVGPLEIAAANFLQVKTFEKQEEHIVNSNTIARFQGAFKLGGRKPPAIFLAAA
jgi:hypothetical protein